MNAGWSIQNRAMDDPSGLSAHEENPLDDVGDVLQSSQTFFNTVMNLKDTIGMYAVLVIFVAMQIKKHHWRLRERTNSVPSTFVSNATRRSNVWVKLHYSDDALPSDLKKSPSLRTLKKHGFECVGAGDAIKLQMERFSLNLFVSVFVESDALETATPIALLHPLAIRQSLIVTKEKTIALMSADNPSVDSEGNFHRTARSTAVKQFMAQNKKSVSNTTRNSFWRCVDWCLWRYELGIFSSRPKLSIANLSTTNIWVRCGVRSLAELQHYEEDSQALFGLTKIAPLSAVLFRPHHSGLAANQTLQVHVDVYKGPDWEKLTLSEVQSHVVPLNHVLGIYSDDDSLTTYEEQKVMKKKKKSVNFGNLNFDSDDDSDVSDLDVEEAHEANNNSEEREENPWSKENNWHPNLNFDSDDKSDVSDPITSSNEAPNTDKREPGVETNSNSSFPHTDSSPFSESASSSDFNALFRDPLKMFTNLQTLQTVPNPLLASASSARVINTSPFENMFANLQECHKLNKQLLPDSSFGRQFRHSPNFEQFGNEF